MVSVFYFERLNIIFKLPHHLKKIYEEDPMVQISKPRLVKFLSMVWRVLQNTLCLYFSRHISKQLSSKDFRYYDKKYLSFENMKAQFKSNTSFEKLLYTQMKSESASL